MIWKLPVLIFLFLVGVSLSCVCRMGSNRSKIYSFQINGCNPAEKNCSISKSTPSNVEIEFEPEVNSDTLQDYAIGCTDTERFEIFMNISNKCLEISCPIQKGVRYNLKDTVPADPNYPTGNVKVLYSFIGDNGMNVLCSTVDIIFTK